jgi:hypothetical protein
VVFRNGNHIEVLLMFCSTSIYTTLTVRFFGDI